MSTEQERSNYSSSGTTTEDASIVRRAATPSTTVTVTTAPAENRRNSICDVPELQQQRNTVTGTLLKRPYHHSMNIIPFIMILIWPCMISLPLSLTIQYSPFHYSKIFPIQWYDTTTASSSASFQPKPLGLLLGILSVGVGQVFVWIFFYFYKYGYLSSSSSSTTATASNDNDNNTETAASKTTTSTRASNKSSKPNDSRNDSKSEPTSVQTKGSPQYEYIEGVRTHVSQPEGFAVLIAYLGITWMYRLIPMSYYQFTTTEGSNNNYSGIQYRELFFCLVVQDGIQYIMHRLEHDASPKFYQYSHKPHHKFLNPRLFDAFNGSLLDTICMIIVPLYMTANIVRTCNVWTYMAFGSIYACWLTIIHSEYTFIWDPLFRMIGFGTPADHHVHHAFFKYNYGHLFMWFDQFCGTYQNPHAYVPKYFNEGV